MATPEPEQSVPHQRSNAAEPAKALLTPVARIRPFNIIHLIVFFICWFPLNPLVVESLRNPNFSMTFSVETLLGILSMVCGPFAPLLFYRNPELHAGLILVTGMILSVCILIQICWRPSLKHFEVIRQIVWAVGWWLWFAGAFVAFVILM